MTDHNAWLSVDVADELGEKFLLSGLSVGSGVTVLGCEVSQATAGEAVVLAAGRGVTFGPAA